MSDTFVFVARPGEVNDIRVFLGFYPSVIEANVDQDVTGQGRCEGTLISPGNFEILCPESKLASVSLGDMNDRADVNAQQPYTPGTLGGLATINGGTGNDTIRSSNAIIDRFIGATGNDVLIGAIRNDLLSGGAGDDRLVGAAGLDRVYGSVGNDLIVGGPGDDHLYGGPGNDRVYVDAGRDFVDAGPGNDYVSALNHARNVVRCGTGYDTVRADSYDVLIGCERRV